MSKRKKTTPTSNLILALTFAFFSVLGYLGISYITSSRPFTFLTAKPSINLIMGSPDATIKEQASNIKTAKKEVVEQKKTTYKEKSITTKPETITTTTSATCPGGNGTIIPAGMWVATGAMYGEDSNQRQCVKCGENGRYDLDQDVSCGSIFASNPDQTILPNNPGPEYTNYSEVLPSCYRGNTIYPDSAVNNNQKCAGGTWVDQSTQQDDPASECAPEQKSESTGYVCSADGSKFFKNCGNGKLDTETGECLDQPITTPTQNSCESSQKLFNIDGSDRWITCSTFQGKPHTFIKYCLSPNQIIGGICIGDKADLILSQYRGVDEDAPQDLNYVDFLFQFNSTRKEPTIKYVSSPNECLDGLVSYHSEKDSGSRYSCVDYSSLKYQQEEDNQVSTTKLENGKTCNIPSNCQSGWCDPDPLNFGNYVCADIPNPKVVKQIGESGKYATGAQCQDSDQCEDGLFCSKSPFLPNRCKSLKLSYPLIGETCQPFSLKDSKQCANCSDGYSIKWDGYLKAYCKGDSPDSTQISAENDKEENPKKENGESCLINFQCSQGLVCADGKGRGLVLTNKTCVTAAEAEKRSDDSQVSDPAPIIISSPGFTNSSAWGSMKCGKNNTVEQENLVGESRFLKVGDCPDGSSCVLLDGVATCQ